MKLVKVSAAGNDFVIAGPATPDRFSQETIREMCDRHFGIGADGVLVATDQTWSFFNADGSEASFCGNGARALALFENLILKGPATGQRKTKAGPVGYDVLSENEVKLRFARNWVQNETVSDAIEEILHERIPETRDAPVAHVVAGVPHTVVNFSELSFPPPAEWVERTQDIHSEWKRRNCDRNLTMAWKTGPTTAGAMTFERGIVGATLACGSGALAVSHAFFGQGACTVVMPGGSLKIDMNPQAVTLAGPVRFVASLDQTRWGI